jgi:hypothetical protein
MANFRSRKTAKKSAKIEAQKMTQKQGKFQVKSRLGTCIPKMPQINAQFKKSNIQKQYSACQKTPTPSHLLSKIQISAPM